MNDHDGVVSRQSAFGTRAVEADEVDGSRSRHLSASCFQDLRSHHSSDRTAHDALIFAFGHPMGAIGQFDQPLAVADLDLTTEGADQSPAFAQGRVLGSRPILPVQETNQDSACAVTPAQTNEQSIVMMPAIKAKSIAEATETPMTT